MKNSLLLALIFMPLNTLLADTVTTKTYAKAAKTCSGSGICTVTTTSSNMEGYITTKWRLNDDGTLLTMTIPHETISSLPEYLLDQLDNNEFVMETSFDFPEDIAFELGGTEITIPAGVYSVSRKTEGYVVDFPLR